MSTNQYELIGYLYVDVDNVTYFDSFGAEYIPNENKKFIGNNIIKPNIGSPNNVWILLYCICWFYAKDLLDYSSLFSSTKYEKNHK